MISIKTYSALNPPTLLLEREIASFLYKHLDEFGDPLEDIQRALDYALKRNNKPGGIIVTSWDGYALTGAVVLNQTGMQGYIPENILVYIATHVNYRGQGIGRALMIETISESRGDIALHVEPNNPAKRLYESLGFSNKYLEMRLKK